MGRSAECERLVAWTAGKSPLVALFAPTIAYAADDIHLLIHTLKAPAIRQLFDWAADQRARAAGDHRGAPRGDLRIPVGETLTKCLVRERKAWMPLIDPDGIFRADVRTLRGLVA